MESFLASSADAADSAAEGERQGADDDGVVKEEAPVEEGGGPEELLRLLTSDEVGSGICE